MKIHALPQHIIARIAAGEVIERQVYAVKELVENSVDAHATQISIQIEQSGLQKIVVTDNGEGMDEEDIMKAFQPHTTSKLGDEGLIGIYTLGFRGEALASITAISDIMIQSRISTAAGGHYVRLHNGKLQNSGPIGMPYGTMVTVENLFSTVPARKKFLKSERTEFRHIVELITQYALSYPDIRFLLIHNKRVILDLPKTQALEERITKLLGQSIASQLIPIVSNNQHIRLSGFVGRPQIATKGQSKQYLFINKRVVNDKLISSAVKEAFGNFLETSQSPFYILSLDVPYETVDVNIHPRKETISFVNRTLIFDTVKKSVHQSLENNNLTFSGYRLSSVVSHAGTTDTYAAQFLRETTPAWSVKNSVSILNNSDIMQLHKVYLLTQTKNGLILIDQHAAHERILYEQFKSTMEQSQRQSQTYKLINPLIIDLPFAEMEKAAEHVSSLESMGFELEEFSENSYRIDALPELFQDRDIRTLILELFEELATEKSSQTIDTISNKMLSFLACRSAIMAGEMLTQQEARRLISQLEKTKNNTTCPHGRPTKIEISLSELHQIFKRE